MKKFKIVFNLITVALTTGLLVIITLAWYVTNKQANVTPTMGSVADLDEVVDTVEYYNFKDYNSTTNVYTVRQYVKHVFGQNEDWSQIRYFTNEDVATSGTTENYDNHFEMNKFDYLKQGYSKYLVRITLKQDKALSDLQFLSTASYFIGYSSEGGDGSVPIVESLSMSSVIKFGLLTNTVTIAANHSTVTFVDNANYQHFDYTHAVDEVEMNYYGAISTSRKSIASSQTPSEGGRLTFNVLIDYNLDALNAFYGNNLSTSDKWGTGEVDGTNYGRARAPQFNILDFKIFILG